MLRCITSAVGADRFAFFFGDTGAIHRPCATVRFFVYSGPFFEVVIGLSALSFPHEALFSKTIHHTTIRGKYPPLKTIVIRKFVKLSGYGTSDTIKFVDAVSIPAILIANLIASFSE